MGARIHHWQNLEVWQKAHRMVLDVYRVVQRFPAAERFRMTDQLCRAAISVPTNIAEGKGRNSIREYIAFLSIARRSVEEVQYLLLLAKDLGYLDEACYHRLHQGYTDVGKMLTRLIRALGRWVRPSPPRAEHRRPRAETAEQES
jgi:four helix bundle protein